MIIVYNTSHSFPTRRSSDLVTTRDASAIVKYIKHNSKGVDQVLAEKFVQTKSKDYLKFIMTKFEEYYRLTRTSISDFEIDDKLGDVREIDIAKKLILKCDSKKDRNEE